jgi:hypothetical protein
MKVLERHFTLQEEKYGILSENYYAARMTRAGWRATMRTTSPMPISVGGKGRTRPGDGVNRRIVGKCNSTTWLTPYPQDPSLAATFPHHKVLPSDMEHHCIPAPDISFTHPNLPVLLQDIEALIQAETDSVGASQPPEDHI